MNGKVADHPAASYQDPFDALAPYLPDRTDPIPQPPHLRSNLAPMRLSALILRNATGRALGTYLLQPGANTMDLHGIAPGGYLLRTANGGSLRVFIME